MIHNYLKVALRNLIKHRYISLIMVGGLAASMAAFLLITRYVFYELSYDAFHQNADNIYRIRLDDYKNGVLTNSSAISYYAEAPAIKEAFPEVQDFVRLHEANGMISYQSGAGEVVSYHEKRAFYTDSSFFNVFSFSLIKGSADRVLRRPESVVISESMAQKYFGREDPIGKTLTLNSNWKGGTYVVEGVFTDFPPNSHFHFDFLFSIQNLLTNQQFANGGWYWTNFYTYLLLTPGTSAESLENRLPGLIEKHIGNMLRKYKVEQRFILQPLRDIHLYSRMPSEIESNGKIETVYILVLVALLILSIGWLNYINLTTALGIERTKEVGIRKALGSGKQQLVRQFLFESFVVNVSSLFFAAILFVLILAVFDGWIHTPIGYTLFQQPVFWVVALVIFGLGFFLSGFYPAFILSSYKPIVVLKGRISRQVGGELLRKGLVVFQFTASVVLIIATIVINQQLNFMQNQDLGMNIEQKLVVKAPKVLRSESFTNELALFKERVGGNAGVRNITASSEIPGQEIFWTQELKRFQDTGADFKLCSVLAVDEDFISAYEIKVLAGRNFHDNLLLDDGAVIINQTALRAFGFPTPESAINQKIGDINPKRIVGVVQDFHQQSLKMVNSPILFYHIPWNSEYLTITLQGNTLRSTIPAIEATFQEVYPGNAFEYFFLDDHFQQQYESEERLAKLFSWFSLLAVGIACLGLLGLAMYTAKNRTKEIGVRKVLGASIGSIVVLLSKDFLRPVGLAVVLASCLAWYAMDRWLQDFANRIELAWWVFALAGALAVGIALITVSFHSIRAAMMNPVKNLRSE
ncbi:ABC transporter permease [Telluribacter humicola]|uniref:ABC transporter permease n=1 Tax=Telluribacter humicola TaxID=1720261 RepID=UPI001A961B1C|nr:ABC transporter permease [Telluribacter humicola]